MKVTSILSVFIALAFSQCSIQKHPTKWIIQNAKTNYVQKGFLDTDYFRPPKSVLGREIEITESKIVLSSIKDDFTGSALFTEFEDTIRLEKEIYIQSREDDEQSLQYPGDELTDCILEFSDSCTVSKHFLSLLETKENNIKAYLSFRGKLSKTRCILFVLQENKKLVLYSENDFLLLFLIKR